MGRAEAAGQVFKGGGGAGGLAGFHDRALSAITPADVRAWYTRTRKALQKAVKNRPGATGAARLRQAYSLLRTILNAAVKDRLISENPCQIEGAGQVNDPERPYLSPEHLAAIVGAMPEKWHLPIRVAFGAHLRVGELEALQRGDYASGALRVERQRIYVRGEATTTPTKTGEARTVVLPPSIAAEVEAYLASTTGFPKSPFFPRRDGEAITGNALGHAWRKAARGVGLGQFHVQMNALKAARRHRAQRGDGSRLIRRTSPPSWRSHHRPLESWKAM